MLQQVIELVLEQVKWLLHLERNIYNFLDILLTILDL